MKKFLHGRRHLRARRSVQAGREKRFIRKCDRAFREVNKIDWFAIGKSLSEAARGMVEAAAAMAPILQREVRRINGLVDLGTASSNERLKEIIRGLS